MSEKPGQECYPCPLCQRVAVKITDRVKEDYGMVEIHTIECSFCQVFRIRWHSHNDYPKMGKADGLALSRLSARQPPSDPLFIENAAQAKMLVSDVLVPRNAMEQAESVLRAIAEEAPNLGQFTDYHPLSYWVTMCLFPLAQGISPLFQELAKCGLILLENNREPLGSNESNTPWRTALTMDGWVKCDSLRKRSQSQTAFVAMWFHESMTPIYDDGIKPALESMGWRVVRIDREHFHNRIDDEILRKINEASLVVADFTGARPGVYFEAGYALAQGKPVIWTCNQSWRTQLQTKVSPDDPQADPALQEQNWTQALHFDTKTYPHLFWDDAANLKNKLEDRLAALNLRPNASKGERQ